MLAHGRVWLTLALLLGLAIPARCTPPATDSADTVGRRFFSAIRAHDYATAYGLLSEGVRRDLPFSLFAQRSRDILTFQIVTLRAVERGRHLVRYEVKGKLRIVYRGDLFDAVYGGTVGVSSVAGGWRIAQVDLAPLEQKRLGKAPPSYHI